MEYKQIPCVQWHTPHFCPLLDVTNTRGGRAKGRTLSDLVIQNFSNMLRAVWDYSRLPMRWVRNTRRAAKQLPGKPAQRKRKKQPCTHPFRHLAPVCLSGTVHHFGLLNYHLVTLKPTHWERFCQVQKEVRLMPRIWGQKNLEFSQSFPSRVQDKKTVLAHPINVLLPRAHCKMVCAGAF